MRSSEPDSEQRERETASIRGESVETLKRYFEHLFANSRDIMNLFSLSEGRVIMLNKAAEHATGYSLVELQTLPVLALYPSEEHEKLKLAFDRLLDTGFSSDKLCMYARSGELRDIWTRSYVVQREPEPVCIVHTIDITEENRKRERELRDARLATLGQASATLAHELKNALQSMQFSLATLRAQLTENGLERTAGSLARIERAAAHMDDVISGIEKSANRSKAGSSFVSIPAAVQNTVQLMQGYLLAKGIEVITEFDQLLPLVWCDQSHLEQILIVLIKNAAQAMASREQRELRVAVLHVDDALRLEVSDTGGGLPPEIEARLFDAFATSKPSGLGQGLGLSTAKQLAQDNELRLEFTSTAGVGTTFALTFTLPSGNDPRGASEKLSGRIVLVVGDDPTLIQQANVMLGEAGARVLIATTAAEALQLLRVHAIAALVVDDSMYPVGGREFIVQARTLFRGSVCLVVNDRQKHAADDLTGVNAVLKKPIQGQALVVTLDALLA